MVQVNFISYEFPYIPTLHWQILFFMAGLASCTRGNSTCSALHWPFHHRFSGIHASRAFLDHRFCWSKRSRRPRGVQRYWNDPPGQPRFRPTKSASDVGKVNRSSRAGVPESQPQRGNFTCCLAAEASYGNGSAGSSRGQ